MGPGDPPWFDTACPTGEGMELGQSWDMLHRQYQYNDRNAALCLFCLSEDIKGMAQCCQLGGLQAVGVCLIRPAGDGCKVPDGQMATEYATMYYWLQDHDY